MNYTSLELSKKLYKNGCELESEICWAENSYLIEQIRVQGKSKVLKNGVVIPLDIYPAYDILNDICVKYAKEFFHGAESYNEACAIEIMRLLRQNKKQKAEEVIWEHCLFNPENKK